MIDARCGTVTASPHGATRRRQPPPLGSGTSTSSSDVNPLSARPASEGAATVFPSQDSTHTSGPGELDRSGPSPSPFWHVKLGG